MKMDGFHSWLTAKRTSGTSGNYAHHLVQEFPETWSTVLPEVVRYFKRAHDDAIRLIRDLAGSSLHPLGAQHPADPVMGYPYRLHRTVLKGYFGEVLAGLLAENMAIGGHDDWVVPAFLFRHHRVAFQQLEKYRLHDGPLPPVPGRTGDDCLAFRRDSAGLIVAALYCESKCSADHDTGLIDDAHEKLKAGAIVDILQLIEVLKDSPEPGAKSWAASLREFHHRRAARAWLQVDVVCYVCGRKPQRQGTWLPDTRPHKKYGRPGRRLEAIEVHLSDVDLKVAQVYTEREWV